MKNKETLDRLKNKGLIDNNDYDILKDSIKQIEVHQEEEIKSNKDDALGNLHNLIAYRNRVALRFGAR